jgi:hypothetical protein
MRREMNPQRLTKSARHFLLTTLFLLAGLGFLPSALMPTAQAATFTVTNTNSGGPGSFRQALTNSNGNAGTDTITFQIGSGAKTITLSAALPAITDPVIIDGSTQPGYAGIPLIELNGANVTTDSGLTIFSGNTTVKGLVINRFGSQGILLRDKGGNVIVNNYIGTNASGTSALGNGQDGINIQQGSGNNQIGGPTPSTRNVISGNASNGIVISSSAGGDNKIYGNYIGLNAAGTAAVGNGTYGIWLFTSNNIIGAAIGRNVISGNGRGIGVQSGSGNFIKGNYIGLNSSGTAAIGNDGPGIEVDGPFTAVGGTGLGEGNVISGNKNSGISISATATGSIVVANKIGTNPAGTLAIGNQSGGIRLQDVSEITVGGATSASRNIISGNQSTGIGLNGVQSSGNKISGNYIGTDINGTAALGNQGSGVVLYDGSNNTIGGAQPGERNVISGNGASGIGIFGEACHGNAVQGNYIGTNVNASAALGNTSAGIRLEDGSNNTIGGTLNTSGNVISGNGSHAVTIGGVKASGNVVKGNYIGTNQNGTVALGNTGTGVWIIGAPNNIIGGTQAGDRNIISANGSTGVSISGETAKGNVVQNNRIGTDAAGNAALGNKSIGIRIIDGPNNVIGGNLNSGGNVISGNGSDGVSIEGAKSTGCSILGNYIGTNQNGTIALGNSGSGVELYNAPNNLVGGAQANERNIISGNGSGVALFGETCQGNVVQNNRIGTDAAGAAPLGNTGYGVRVLDAPNNLIGGTLGNVISGNGFYGISIEGTKSVLNKVKGNFIGTNLNGSYAIGNKGTGVGVEGLGNLVGGATPAERNIISGNFSGGVVIHKGSGNFVQGNHIGLNAAGSSAIPNASIGVRIIDGSNNTIGGTGAGMRNVISGNNRGITMEFNSPGNVIQGNYIGTDATGTFKIGNDPGSGIDVGAPSNTIGGLVAAAGNLISGNRYGIYIYGANATGNKIQGNYVGTKADGTSSIPNHYAAIYILNAFNNMIGGTEAGAGNVIAGTNFNGLYVNSGSGNAFLSNSIHSNAGLGIDLVTPLGVNSNDVGDGDFGANLRQNYPVLKSATLNGNNTNIQGQLKSNPNLTFRVEIFSNVTCDPSGLGEGKTFMGAVTVTTDANGNASINTVLPVLPTGNYVTATATSSDNNTSEFSPCALVGGPSAGQFQFDNASYVFNETAGEALITVTRSNGNTGQATVNYATSDGSATAGLDYTATSGTLIFEDGEVVKTFAVPLTFDEEDEGNQEDFFLALSNPTGGATLGSQISTKMFLIDYDLTGPIISIGSVTVVEGNDGTTDAVFTIHTTPHTDPVVVSFETEDGSAKAGADYEAKADSVTFNPGELTKTVSVKIKGDAVKEGNEVFRLRLTSIGPAAYAGDDGDGCTIIDDDGPALQFESGGYSVNENDGARTITVKRIGSAASAVSVNYATADGTAKAGEDYAATSGTLNFGIGETSKSFTVAINNDGSDEADETLTINLSNPAGDASLGSPSTTTITINDDDLPLPSGTLQFASNGLVVTENGGQVEFVVSRTNGSSGAVSVQYTTADGTAHTGEDYAATSGTLAFADGEITKSFFVQIANDGADEPDETMNVALINPTGGASLGPQTEVTLTITDDDPLPTLTISDVTITEGDSGLTSLQFKVGISAASGKAVTVDYSTADGSAQAGSDYQAVNGTLTFALGQTAQTVTVTAIGDSSAEPDETFVVNLSNPTNANIGVGQGQGTIKNDDQAPAGALQFSAIDYSAGENDAEASINVMRTNGSAGAVSVDFAVTAGTAQANDFTAASGTLHFADGETSKTFVVPIVNDQTNETEETINLVLSNPKGGASLGSPDSAVLFITDDDPLPDLSVSNVSLPEGNGGPTSFIFNVTLSAVSAKTVTVDFATAPGTASKGADYQPINGTLTFSPGETSKPVTVMVNGDTEDEPDETFLVELSNLTNATVVKGQGTGTIANDDAPAGSTIQFSQGDYGAQEDLGAMTLTVTRTGDTSGSASVDYATKDNQAQQKSDYEVAAGTLNFAPGETTKTLTILLNEDSCLEGAEGFSVVLNNPNGAALGQTTTATVTIVDDSVEPFVNPIDDAGVFVYTHYHDFLNREPDLAGLQFWTNQIESCGTDAQCREARRINVSAAFFLSIEFQGTGYLRYLLEKESFASTPKYTEFMRDVQEVSRGVIVNSPGWQQKLAANQQQFAEEWASRPAFKATYDAMSNVDYVNALYANAGIQASTAERQSLVNALDTASESRAAVLLEVAAHPAFRQKEHSAAFVMMQYFGYLRRDPQAAPDSDLSGYNFWLTKLISFDGDFQQAEMVKAFLNSIEYRGRFAH